MFQIDAQGYPLLLSWDSIKNARLLHKKLLIGKFLSDMHRAYCLPTFRLLSHLHICCQRWPLVVPKSLGHACEKLNKNTFWTSIYWLVVSFLNSIITTIVPPLTHCSNTGQQGKRQGSYHSTLRKPSHCLGGLRSQARMLLGTHRNRELAGALTCRNLLILGPPTSIMPESVMSLPRIVRSQQPHRTLAKNSDASGVARAKASTMKMHSPRFGAQTVLPSLLSQPG